MNLNFDTKEISKISYQEDLLILDLPSAAPNRIINCSIQDRPGQTELSCV